MAGLKKVNCPNCHSLLTIPDTEGISERMLKCPVCSFRAKVSVFMNHGSSKDNNDDEPTQVSFHIEDRTIGSLYLGQTEYALKKGVTTIGRRARTGHAQMQISDDMYMSRQHAIIEVREGGSGLEHHLRADQAKNPIKVNGTAIANGDVIVLTFGDKLLFGHTELLFQRPGFFDEATQIG